MPDDVASSIARALQTGESVQLPKAESVQLKFSEPGFVCCHIRSDHIYQRSRLRVNLVVDNLDQLSDSTLVRHDCADVVKQFIETVLSAKEDVQAGNGLTELDDEMVKSYLADKYGIS